MFPVFFSSCCLSVRADVVECRQNNIRSLSQIMWHSGHLQWHEAAGNRLFLFLPRRFVTTGWPHSLMPLRGINLHVKVVPRGKTKHKIGCLRSHRTPIKQPLLLRWGKGVRPWLICDRRGSAAPAFASLRNTTPSAGSYSGFVRSEPDRDPRRRRRRSKCSRSSATRRQPHGFGPGGRRCWTRDLDWRNGRSSVPQLSGSDHVAHCGRLSWTPGWSRGR